MVTWLLQALEPPKEPQRPKTHWDHVLEEMVWLSKVMLLFLLQWFYLLFSIINSFFTHILCHNVSAEIIYIDKIFVYKGCLLCFTYLLISVFINRTLSLRENGNLPWQRRLLYEPAKACWIRPQGERRESRLNLLFQLEKELSHLHWLG